MIGEWRSSSYPHFISIACRLKKGWRVCVSRSGYGRENKGGAFLEAFQHVGRNLVRGKTARGLRKVPVYKPRMDRHRGGKRGEGSMDGKGRWMDSGFTERLWWAVSHEGVYSRAHENVRELELALEKWLCNPKGRQPSEALATGTQSTAATSNPIETSAN